MQRHPLHRGRDVRERPGLPGNHRLPAVYRLCGEASPETVADELGREPRLALVEAALLAADEPLTPRRVAAVAGLTDVAEARRLIERLQRLYDQDGSAFQVEELAGGFQLLTRPAFHPWLARLRRSGAEVRLSAPARETLAIIAYRQPITRADVEAIRGVQSSDMLHQLMEKGLVRIAGRDDSLGRPVLYATTRKFLQLFGLRSLRDLPQAAELAEPGKRRRKTDEEAET